MNETLSTLAEQMQKQAIQFLPKAYLAGKLKAQRRFGILSKWSDRDRANIILLLNRHAEELSKAMVTAETRIAAGETLASIIETFAGRVGAWSWALYPAMSLGMTSYVDDNRTEIAEMLPPPPAEQGQVARVPENDIGIIWHIVDETACKICHYLNGRWFDAHEAYSLAASTHPNCRCVRAFDVGTPDEALVGPIPDYKPGTAQDIYANLNIAGLAQARAQTGRQEMNRVRRQNTPRGVLPGEVWDRQRINRERRRNIPRAKVSGEKSNEPSLRV